VQDGVEAGVGAEALAAQDEVRAEGEARPGVGDAGRLWGGGIAWAEFDHAVAGEVAAEQAHAAAGVGLVGHPDEAVRADAEEFGAVVVAVFDPEAEARRGSAHAPAGDIEAGVCGELAEGLRDGAGDEVGRLHEGVSVSV
jgi:hypothetical protein